LALAIAYLIGRAVGASDDTVLYIAIVVSFVPAVVTWIVGLVRGRSE
jgi:hypothetical protein